MTTSKRLQKVVDETEIGDLCDVADHVIDSAGFDLSLGGANIDPQDSAETGLKAGIRLGLKAAKLQSGRGVKQEKVKIYEADANSGGGRVVFYFVGVLSDIIAKLERKHPIK